MGLYYKNQVSRPVIGSKTTEGFRTGITLESTYQTTEETQATKSFKTGGFAKLDLAINYTMGAAETANSIEVKIEQSPDGINWYRLPIDTVTTVSTILNREWTHVGVNAAADPFSIILDIAYQYVRVSCKESGVAANKGTVYVEATLSGF